MDKFVTVEVETIGKEKIEKVCITKKNKYSLEEENYIPISEIKDLTRVFLIEGEHYEEAKKMAKLIEIMVNLPNVKYEIWTLNKLLRKIKKARLV